MGSVVIPHLSSGWHVDQAILSEDERLVVIRFGRDWDPACMQQDEVLYKIAEKVKSFAVVYVCDIDQVPDFNQMYGAYFPPFNKSFIITIYLALANETDFFCIYRALRPMYNHVLLSQQAHDGRLWHRKQQQAQLGPRGQAGAHRHCRDRLSRREKGPRSRRQPQGLLDAPPILNTPAASLATPLLLSITYIRNIIPQKRRGGFHDINALFMALGGVTYRTWKPSFFIQPIIATGPTLII